MGRGMPCCPIQHLDKLSGTMHGVTARVGAAEITSFTTIQSPRTSGSRRWVQMDTALSTIRARANSMAFNNTFHPVLWQERHRIDDGVAAYADSWTGGSADLRRMQRDVW